MLERGWLEVHPLGVGSFLLGGHGRVGFPDLAVNPVVKEKYLGTNFELKKKNFQEMAEAKRRKEMEEEVKGLRLYWRMDYNGTI